MTSYRRPSDLAKSMRSRTAEDVSRSPSFRRDTFALPREAARAKARELFDRYPKAAYMTEIEHWRELPDGGIEFTVRRLPSADSGRPTIFVMPGLAPGIRVLRMRGT
jgi:hypothetical protein